MGPSVRKPIPTPFELALNWLHAEHQAIAGDDFNGCAAVAVRASDLPGGIADADASTAIGDGIVDNDGAADNLLAAIVQGVAIARLFTAAV